MGRFSRPDIPLSVIYIVVCCEFCVCNSNTIFRSIVNTVEAFEPRVSIDEAQTRVTVLPEVSDDEINVVVGSTDN